VTNARAVVLTGPRQLELRTLPVPDHPPARGAILKVLRNGICGSDYDLYCGNFPLALTLPVVPGHEIVGEIVAVDPFASRNWGVTVGTRVAVEAAVRCGDCEPCRLGHMGCVNTFAYSAAPVSFGAGLWGGMAEYMVLLPGSSVYPLPPSMPLDVAGLFNVFGNATEWTARLGDVALGDRTVVLGAGQRGIACGAIAHLRGASEVVVTGLHRDAHKLEVASDLGATATIDVEGRDVVDAVRNVLGGDRADVVIDTTPRATASIQHAVELVRPEGTIVLAGLKHVPLTGFVTDQLLMKNVTLKAALGTKPVSAVAALRTLAAGRLPFERLFSMTVPLDGVERGVQVVGGEHSGEAPIHISVDPWE
jgi:threonine dehydrogenase-like Zn-dependent dehydrogenase